jgi:hypothetical protein
MSDESAASRVRQRRRLRPRLAAQVLLSLGGLLALLVAAITVALVMVMIVRRDESSLSDRDVPYASAVASAALNAKGIATDQRGFLLTGDQSFIAEAEQRTGDARIAFATAQRAATDTANATRYAALSPGSKIGSRHSTTSSRPSTPATTKPPSRPPWDRNARCVRPTSSHSPPRKQLVNSRSTRPANRRQQHHHGR